MEYENRDGGFRVLEGGSLRFMRSEDNTGGWFRAQGIKIIDLIELS